MKNTEIQKGDFIVYTDRTNSVLTNGSEYKVHENLSNGAVRVEITTGFAGLTKDRFSNIV